MESPAYVVTVLDSDVSSVCYPVHGPDSADVLRGGKKTKKKNRLVNLHMLRNSVNPKYAGVKT